MALKENQRKIYDYVKSMNGQDITAEDIANAVGATTRQVNGSLTAFFCKKGLMKRTPAEMELPDGTHKAIKLVSLTEEGLAFDPDASDEEKEEE